MNGRVIQDKSLNVLFKLAYRDFISYDRFPQFVCFINCPHSEVDVNVHPTKNEVRFKDIKSLRSRIINLVKNNLKKVNHFASTINTKKAIDKFSMSSSQRLIELKDISTDSSLNTESIITAAERTKLNNSVMKTGDETIAGAKTFSSTIVGSINGNAGTVTNGVYTTSSVTDLSDVTDKVFTRDLFGYD